MTAAAGRGTGAHAPARLPTTTGHPARASSHEPVAGQPAPPQPGREPLRPPDRRDQHDGAAVPGAHGRIVDDGEHEVDQVGDRRQAHHRGTRLVEAQIPAGGERRGAALGPRRAAALRGGAGGARTTVAGEATRRKNDAGPAQRHAAQSASSTSAGGGPQPSHDLRGRRSTPGCVATSASTTQPRTDRPWSGTRTRLPTRTSWSHSGGTT